MLQAADVIDDPDVVVIISDTSQHANVAYEQSAVLLFSW